MKLYYHKTSGGAEYLCSKAVEGTTEGSLHSPYIVRIDGNIRKDAELIGSGVNTLAAMEAGADRIAALPRPKKDSASIRRHIAKLKRKLKKAGDPGECGDIHEALDFYKAELALAKQNQPRKERNIVYKVWIEIERYNEKTGDGETMDAPGASVDQFNTYEEAYEFAEQMTRQAGGWLPPEETFAGKAVQS